MIKLYQPLALQLTISTTEVLTSSVSSAYWAYKTPNGTTGSWSTVVLVTSSASTVYTMTYSFSSGILNEEGEWKITPYINISSQYYPCDTYEMSVYGVYSTCL